MLKDLFVLSLKSLLHRPIRNWLTILGIIIGITLVVIILALGDGIQNAVINTLQMFGSDLIVIFPGKETNPFISLVGGQKFKEKDLLELEKIDGVRFVVPRDIALLNVEYGGEKKSVMIHAAPWYGVRKVFEESQGVKLEEGKWPDNDQEREVVLGYKTANELFKRKVKIGDEITIKSKRMKVVGIISSIGEQASDNVIYMSLDIFRDITGFKNYARSAFVKIKPEANIDLVAKQIRAQLSKQEVVNDFTILTSEKSKRLISNVLSIVQLFLVSIALIFLIVGAVGIMNTMYTSVLERTKQIGIMKVIGASNDAILSLFLIKSGIIGLVSGILGIIFGLSLAYLIGLIASKFGINGLFSFASVDFFGLFALLFFTFTIGVVSGILPARQASKMEPAEALKYE